MVQHSTIHVSNVNPCSFNILFQSLPENDVYHQESLIHANPTSLKRIHMQYPHRARIVQSDHSCHIPHNWQSMGNDDPSWVHNVGSNGNDVHVVVCSACIACNSVDQSYQYLLQEVLVAAIVYCRRFEMWNKVVPEEKKDQWALLCNTV